MKKALEDAQKDFFETLNTVNDAQKELGDLQDQIDKAKEEDKESLQNQYNEKSDALTELIKIVKQKKDVEDQTQSDFNSAKQTMPLDLIQFTFPMEYDAIKQDGLFPLLYTRLKEAPMFANAVDV